MKYDDWSKVRLDRLLVDYLLRRGYLDSARELAREKRVEELVDVGVFEEVGRIERSLREGRMEAALGWCSENKTGLRKIAVSSSPSSWMCVEGVVVLILLSFGRAILSSN